MPTNTTNYGLLKPLVNNATDQDLWGGYLNDDMDDIDGLTKTAINWTPSDQTSNFSISAPTTGSTTTGGAKVMYRCDATSGAITASLPAASGNGGMTIAFKKTDSSANAVTIKGNGSENIDGANTYLLSAQYVWAILVCDGTGWNVISGEQTGLAPLNSPAFTGTPTAPTAAGGTNTTQLATTAFANAVFPTPITSTGVGQWREIPAPVGTTGTLPAGGVWAYWGSNNGTGFAGVAAGGTVFFIGSPLNFFGFCWRIA